MLLLKNNSTLLFEGELVELPVEEFNKFILANLNEELQLEQNVNLNNVIELFENCSDFIRDVFLEEVLSLKAFAVSWKSKNAIDGFMIRNHLIIDVDCNLDILPQVIFMNRTDQKDIRIGELILEINNELQVEDYSSNEEQSKIIYKKITLLEFLDCVFFELPEILRNNSEEFYQVS